MWAHKAPGHVATIASLQSAWAASPVPKLEGGTLRSAREASEESDWTVVQAS